MEEPPGKKKEDRGDEDQDQSVKSTAIVKYSSATAPASYMQLQCNTDLNLPPSNWLSNSTELYGLHPNMLQHRSGFSSFKMAHMFPDVVGVVDVVSDAENVKKLLKIPYSRGPVSMIVHRIENTLLIDEFDVHRYLLRGAENEWEWFKKFFVDHVKNSLDSKRICDSGKSRNALKQRSLVSKFLYHSLVVADNQPKIEEPDDVVNADPTVPIPLPYKDESQPVLPEPSLEEELPGATSNHKFSRNVIWTFEDIQMLLGIDMPIFGGGTHPCISLRLRDMAKPINVLTGMDYWLDNLMCNVPEVVMCYHLNGIVQKYELIKTEDLPHLENSKFSPNVIRDVAQNILSFLKSNATKAGHTYWLFKGKDDDVVKLYDLTSLCTDVLDEKGQTPFTIPVAMLLYRVARNMKNSSDGRRQSASIRMLLQNCVSILSEEQYPQIVTSAHYMLSDLYVPADINPAFPDFSQESSNEDEEYESENEEDKIYDEELGTLRRTSSIKTLSLSSLGEPQSEDVTCVPRPPPLKGDLEYRCKEALKHVVTGIFCLQFLRKQEETKNSKKGEEPAMAKPFQTIPMPYKEEEEIKNKKTKNRRKKNKNVQEEELSPTALSCKTNEAPSPSAAELDWDVHLKVLLYEKACLVYATLAEKCYSDKKFGLSLHYIQLILKSRLLISNLTSQESELDGYLLGRAGDALFMIVQRFAEVEEHNNDYLKEVESEKELLKGVKVDQNFEHFPPCLTGLEDVLLASCNCYLKALSLEKVEAQKQNLLRRLGNIENEIGCYYMNQAATRWQEAWDKKDIKEEKKSEFKQLFTTSLSHLESGIKAFETVQDAANLALLHSNTGRLMRLRAHFHSPQDTDRTELAGQERHFYNKALISYQKALQVLGDRRQSPAIWDSVTWELSTALFTLATLLQDFPDGLKSQEEAEREVSELLLKALKLCDTESPGARQLVYMYRTAVIHHRLASLYHSSFRSFEDENKKKKVLHLCKLHYKRAASMFLSLDNSIEYLQVQLEHVGLNEFQAEVASNPNMKIKFLESALELLFESVPVFKIISESPRGKEGEEKDEEESLRKLLALFTARLQSILLTLTKLNLQKTKKVTDNNGQIYKKLYSLTLKPKEPKDNVTAIADDLHNCLIQLQQIYNEQVTR